MPGSKRYEQFGWDYDRYNLFDPKAVAWYLGHLACSGGPVLELACGGGTLLDPIARAGFTVTGLDLSEAMLDRARQRLDPLPREVSTRVSLVRADMADFHVCGTFRTILLADNSFRELPTREGLRACLRCVRGHLDLGGLFLLTERRFDPDLYPGGRRTWPFTPMYEDPGTGERVRRRIEVEVLEGPRRTKGVMFYEITAADGTVTVEECPWTGPVLGIDEYFEMLGETGFDACLRVGYEDRADDGVEPILCFVATAV